MRLLVWNLGDLNCPRILFPPFWPPPAAILSDFCEFVALLAGLVATLLTLRSLFAISLTAL